jgi:hypothetical protein
MSAIIDNTIFDVPKEIFRNHVNGYISEMDNDKINLFQCMEDHLSDEVLQAEFEVCIRCTFCKSHQSNRPVSIDSPFNTEKITNLKDIFPRCSCPCRYSARYLRRVHFFRYHYGVIPEGDEEMEVFYENIMTPIR